MIDTIVVANSTAGIAPMNLTLLALPLLPRLVPTHVVITFNTVTSIINNPRTIHKFHRYSHYSWNLLLLIPSIKKIRNEKMDFHISEIAVIKE
jgi:hypothetical protein